MLSDLKTQKLLIANRGEIAVRVIRTAKRLGIPTIAVFCQPDADSTHVLLADEAIPILPKVSDIALNSKGYLNGSEIVKIGKEHGATLIHPGYGFLSENADFARQVVDAGMTWVGPSPDVIQKMGLKDEARAVAIAASVPVIPGSTLLTSEEEALKVACEIRFPVMLKAAASGGGMGMVVCKDSEDLRSKYKPTKERAKALFHNDGVFLEKYISASRHIEVQVFGTGQGNVIHMGERECSVQRRHQKVIEETPSPFMLQHPDVREKLCQAAVQLCKSINYSSAGTCEFLVDNHTSDFYFLEMNTRLQVEHTVTEEVNPGLDLVELMILQGIAEQSSMSLTVDTPFLSQQIFTSIHSRHSIQARVYCENPGASFKPSPGLLQLVDYPKEDWLRVDGWVITGTMIHPYYDPLACKIVVSGNSREEAILRLSSALFRCKVYGPSNNITYLRSIVDSETFRSGNALTTFLDAFPFIPRVVDVVAGGIETTVQDYPGRTIGFGMPRSGPMDPLAFRAGNIIVGNGDGIEGLEICVSGPSLVFHVAAVAAVTGAPVTVKLNKKRVPMWQSVVIPAGARVDIGTIEGKGLRSYLCIRGGFPHVPKYLQSKSTSMGLGGYQGRALLSGDQLVLGECQPMVPEEIITIPASMVPEYPLNWVVYCLAGPQDDSTFLTNSGRETLYNTGWKISPSSNRMGIRLEGAKINLSRENGGEGGSHPSNILDNGYALGSINLNGDTPVILTNEGPDMGGYLCAAVVASADLWKVGQLQPGSTVKFKRISFEESIRLSEYYNSWLDTLRMVIQGSKRSRSEMSPLSFEPSETPLEFASILHVIPGSLGRPMAAFRQAGDSAILLEYGDMTLDLNIRARIHLFESEILKRNVSGIRRLAPCTRSTMCHFNPTIISQKDVLSLMVNIDTTLPSVLEGVSFPGRRITLPLVLDDKWNRAALERYMRFIRDKAVYLPSNISYLAKNNGLGDGEEGEKEVLRLLSSATWLTVGVGFYLGCPFLVPIDPRCRVLGQKMNPSRTFTPSGAIGIAGVVAAIYPVDSPGGYQLFGRTLPGWQTWPRGRDFSEEKPWLMEPFDQIAFHIIGEDEYPQLEQQFQAGSYKFKVEATTFSMDEYNAFVRSVEGEIVDFKRRQHDAVRQEEGKEAELLSVWNAQKMAAALPDTSVAAFSSSATSTSELVSHLTATVASLSPLLSNPGHIIERADEVLLILEAMKTEIAIEAGEDHVGKRVIGPGEGVKIGELVKAGSALVLFE